MWIELIIWASGLQVNLPSDPRIYMFGIIASGIVTSMWLLLEKIEHDDLLNE